MNPPGGENARAGLGFEGGSHLAEIESQGSAAEAHTRDSALALKPPNLLERHFECFGKVFGLAEDWWCLVCGFNASHTPLQNVTFARMNPRTHRRHREKERQGEPPPDPRLGRPSGETARARDAEALQFCEAVFSCLEEGQIPTLEALREYPRHPAPPGPPVWRSGSPLVRKLIEGRPARVLLLAVWDLMPSLLVAKARTSRSAKGIAEFKKWAKAQTPAGRAKVKQAAARASKKWQGFFGEDSRARLEAIGDELARRLEVHPSTYFAWQIEDTPLEDVVGRKHRGAGAVLGMSRRMVCHYRQRDEYGAALALLDQFKRRTRAKFGGAASKPRSELVDYPSGDEAAEIDFEAMDARLARD